MNILIISSYPPTRCGVAAYARAQAEHLRSQGHTVEIQDVEVLNKLGWTFGSRIDLIERAQKVDKVIVHFQQGLYHSSNYPDFLKYVIPIKTLSSVFRVAECSEVLVHENFEASPLFIFKGPQRKATKEMLSLADSVVFHTEMEKQYCLAQFDGIKAARVVEPWSFYKRHTGLSMTEARARLGIPTDRKVFLCIGFLHRGKGFLEFARVFNDLFGGIDSSPLLYIVTSDRNGTEVEYLEELRKQKSPVVNIVEGYQPDSAFDTWLVASDIVVAPYLYGNTSGPIARAQVYGKKCLVSDIPALKEQVVKGSTEYEVFSGKNIASAIEGCLR